MKDVELVYFWKEARMDFFAAPLTPYLLKYIELAIQ
jgi:hypothetical protein